MNKALLAGCVLALAATGANATIVTYNYTGGYHNEGWVTGGSNGASVNFVYGDGGNYGQAAQNRCVDGLSVTCASRSGITIAAAPPNPGYTGPAVVVNGTNGTYQTNVGGGTPAAQYAGSLSYDDSLTFSYTDLVTNLTETWYVVTGGTLAWTGTTGFEVLVNPSNTSGQVGGSFFSYSFANGNVNLLTGQRTSTAKCDLGIAGAAVVGTLLCGVANPASSYNYASSGSYVKPVNWTGVRDNGDGTIDLLLSGNRYTQLGSGNNLQERLTLTPYAITAPVPVPAAVWLFGSALGVMGIARRRKAA